MSAVKQDKKKEPNVPNLRFPEFTGEWEVSKIRDIVKMISGGTPSMQCPDYWNGNIPLISAQSMHNTYLLSSNQYITDEGLVNGSKLLQKNNLLLLVRGSMLWKRIPICYNLIDVAFNQDVKGVIVYKKSTPLFMLYWFQSKEPLLKSLVTGTSIGAGKLDSDNIFSLSINLPNKDEQSKISRLFSLLDQRISTQNKIIEEQKLLKNLLSKNIFMQRLEFTNDNGICFPEWKIRRLEDVLISIGTKKFQIKNKEILFDGLYKVIDQGQKLVAGYSNREDLVFRKVPVIIFGDHTTILKYVDFPFIIGADGTKLLKNRYDDNIRYLYYNLEYNNVKQDGYKRHYTLLSKVCLQIPSIKEQEKIANCLSSIDMKIDLEISLLLKLEHQKKFLLSNLFINTTLRI